MLTKIHLNYAREYQRLAVNGDRGVELQPVKTAEITATMVLTPSLVSRAALLWILLEVV
jgi:hypothetical protein